VKKINDSFNKIFKGKERVLVVLAHPDDAEIYCGGTIARLIDAGIEVRVVKMTSGNRGSRDEKISAKDLEELRRKEDSASMKVLGVKMKNNAYLPINDGEVENDLKTIERIVKQIREFRPDLIITHNPEDVFIRFSQEDSWVNHRDHRNTGKSAIDAAYPYSRDLLFFPKHFDHKKYKSHTTTEFLLVDYYDHVDNVFIDVTNYLDKRNNALAQHSSQYSLEDAVDATDYFTKFEGTKNRFEKFRYVLTD